MQVAEAGNNVSVHYTGKSEDGTIFDTSKDREPLSFELGAGQMIKGFDEGISGMKIGETKELTLSPEEAYGERKDEYIQEIDKKIFQATEDLEVGKEVVLKDDMERLFTGIVQNIKESSVVIDFNHFLAGKTLHFEVELVSID